jgi:hypothetical protein
VPPDAPAPTPGLVVFGRALGTVMVLSGSALVVLIFYAFFF